MILIFGQFLTNMSQFLFLGCCESSSHLSSGGRMFIDVFIWMMVMVMVMVMVSLKVANSGKDQILDLEPEDQDTEETKGDTKIEDRDVEEMKGEAEEEQISLVSSLEVKISHSV